MTTRSVSKWVVGMRYIPHAPPQTCELDGDIFDYIEDKYLYLVSRYPDGHLREFEYETHCRERLFFWFSTEEKARNNNWTEHYNFIGEVRK